VSLIPEGLHYTKEHEWVSSTGTLYTMGITDFAQGALGDIVYVQLQRLVKHSLPAKFVVKSNPQSLYLRFLQPLAVLLAK